MIIILVYWLFLFVMCLPAGLLIKKACKLETNNLYIVLLTGLFLITVSFSAAAFFMPLNAYTLLPLVLINSIVGFKFRFEASSLIKQAFIDLRSLHIALKFIIAALLIGALLKSAQLPFVIDNESYYLQTIKWLNEYGFVKGLGNLHIFLAQTSSWHVLQAGLNFSFLTDRINDINGFVFMVCTLYFLTEGQKHRNLHWIGLVPVFSILLFLFIDSPSPDLPLLMITPVILYLFVENPEVRDDNNRIAFLLFIFLVFIKITIAPLALLFIPQLNKRNNLLFFSITGFATAILWMAKNAIITGYIFYPFNFVSINTDWVIPQELVNNIGGLTKKHGYYKGTPESGSIDFLSRLKYWIQLPGIAGMLNKAVILLLGVTPFFRKTRQNKKYRIVYISLLCHFLALLFTSPQFRFFLPEIMFLSVFIVAKLYNMFINNYRLYYAALSITTAAAFVLFINVSTKSLTKNKFHQSTHSVSFSQVYLPEKNSRFSDIGFVKRKEGNLEYFSPHENFFFYGTANGPLPCLNEVQLKHYKTKFGYVPQLRSDELQDGFYSLKIKNN